MAVKVIHTHKKFNNLTRLAIEIAKSITPTPKIQISFTLMKTKSLEMKIQKRNKSLTRLSNYSRKISNSTCTENIQINQEKRKFQNISSIGSVRLIKCSLLGNLMRPSHSLNKFYKRCQSWLMLLTRCP